MERSPSEQPDNTPRLSESLGEEFSLENRVDSAIAASERLLEQANFLLVSRDLQNLGELMKSIRAIKKQLRDQQGWLNELAYKLTLRPQHETWVDEKLQCIVDTSQRISDSLAELS
jgi:hypothetical protein